ncbi:alpha/beta fold hydrolase [Nocardia sp. NPDC088792]|uniref:alpha/beta fold hydrolase n=1 Tax=Nocardia sp. NPDC088792 TaxID=3364332 RepID=UPI0038134231
MSPQMFRSLTAMGLATCLTVGVTHQGYATVMSRRCPTGFERHRVRCTSGNILTYYLRRGAVGGPTVVCEAGFMSTSTSWLLVADHLDPDISVLVYDRAGYRGSLRRCPEEYCLAESVADLVEVIADGVGGGFCVLAGHSLGGYIAHRAASAAPDRVHGLVLVDPTHPRELRNSLKQRAGATTTNMAMKLGPWSVTFGGGLLIDKQSLYAFADGSPHAAALRLELSAAATWRAGRREWGYTYAFLLDAGRPLDRLEVPVLVVAAAETLEQTPEQMDLHQKYVVSGTDGSCVTVEGSSHLSVLCSVEHAPSTAQMIEKAVAAITAANVVTTCEELVR